MLYYLTAFINLLSAVLGLHFSIQTVRKETDEEQMNALYWFARSIAFVLLTATPLLKRVDDLLLIITTVMLIIQIIDGLIGIYMKNFMRTVGPFFMAVLHAISIFLCWRVLA